MASDSPEIRISPNVTDPTLARQIGHAALFAYEQIANDADGQYVVESLYINPKNCYK